MLIRLIVSPVNPVDWKIRAGLLRGMIPYALPSLPGRDASGVVHAAGAQALHFQVGDAVYSRPDIAHYGTYAEYARIATNATRRRCTGVKTGTLSIGTASRRRCGAGKATPGSGGATRTLANVARHLDDTIYHYPQTSDRPSLAGRAGLFLPVARGRIEYCDSVPLAFSSVQTPCIVRAHHSP